MLFYSSLLFSTNAISTFYKRYYIYSFFFVALTMTSLLVHTHNNDNNNNNNQYITYEKAILIDKAAIAAVIAIGGYTFYKKCEGFIEPLENRRFSDQAAQNLDSIPRISCGNPVLNNNISRFSFIFVKIVIIATFLFVIYLYCYGQQAKLATLNADGKRPLWGLNPCGVRRMVCSRLLFL